MRLKMIKNFRKAVLTIAAVLSLTLFLSAVPVLAVDCSATNLTAKQQIQCGACTASGNSCVTSPGGQGVQDTIVSVIKVLSLVGGALAVIMLIVGGLRYVISAGNPETTKAAKNTIIYALVGLVIIAVAQIIVQFVLNKATNL
jgi:hypothetical protein